VLSRPTRLRWLAGRRTDQEAWDVYEGVAGAPIALACARPRAWFEVRRWVTDLAREIAAQQPGDHPPLELDRVWILDSGRAKLLDDPTSDLPPATDRLADGIGLLRAVAGMARAQDRQPWPLSAMRFLTALAEAPPASAAELASRTEAAVRGRAAITRGWRGLSIAGLLAMPVLTAAMTAGVLLMMSRSLAATPVETRVAAYMLRELDRHDGGPNALTLADREAAEIVLASRYRSVLADKSLYTPERPLRLAAQHKTLADRILHRSVDPRSAEVATARPAVRSLLEDGARLELPPMGPVTLMLVYGTLVMAALVGLLTALATRGMILRMLGFEIVKTDGRLAGRWRVFARAAIAWSPLLLPAFLSTGLGGIASNLTGLVIIMATALALQLAGAIAAIAHPSRGLQDRVAGTWIVPR
jgi:hypothetical protein